MKKLFGLLIIISLVIFVIAVIYGFIDAQIKATTWQEKEIQGYINEVILYNTFPDNYLLITFIDGNYTVITENRFWAYSHLSTVNPANLVKITYQENYYHRKLATHVEEVRE